MIRGKIVDAFDAHETLKTPSMIMCSRRCRSAHRSSTRRKDIPQNIVTAPVFCPENAANRMLLANCGRSDTSDYSWSTSSAGWSFAARDLSHHSQTAAKPRSRESLKVRMTGMSEPSHDAFGWAAQSLTALDSIAPGLIARARVTSSIVRQAMFAAIAHHDLNGLVVDRERQLDENGGDEFFARVLRSGDPVEILSHVSETVPSAWLEALERIGPNRMGSAQAYLKLQFIFQNFADTRKAEALSGLPTITEMTLQIVDALDERWCHRNTLSRLAGVDDAICFNQAVEFAQAINSRATDQVVASTIARLRANKTLERMVGCWIGRANAFVEPPEGGSNDREQLTVATPVGAGEWPHRPSKGTVGASVRRANRRGSREASRPPRGRSGCGV